MFTRGLPREDASLTIFAAVYRLTAAEDDEQRALWYVSDISRALWCLKETITNEAHKSALAAICAFMDSALPEMQPQKESAPF